VVVRQSCLDLRSCRGMVPPQVLSMWSRTPSRAILRIHPLAIVPKVQLSSMLHRPIILLVSFCLLTLKYQNCLSHYLQTNLCHMRIMKNASSWFLTCARLERWTHALEAKAEPSQTGVAPCLENATRTIVDDEWHR
jgi:hypothetical protein